MKLISINALWCPACLIMRPRIQHVMQNFPDVELVEYDYDMDEDLIACYHAGEILPVFILMDQEKELARIIGEKKEEEILTILKGCMK